MTDTVTKLAQQIRPFWLRDLAGGAVSIAGGGSGGLTAHALDGVYHTGQLAESQATWASTKAELTAHALLPDVHHARATVTAPITIAGQLIGISLGHGVEESGGSLRSKLPTNSGITRDSTGLYLAPSTLTVSTSNGVSGAGHTHAITASADVGTSPAEALLKSTSAGLLTLSSAVATQAYSLGGFASGFAGNGWRIDTGITTASRASAEVDDLTVRGRLRVYELLIQQIRATNGSVFVSSASKVVTVTNSVNPLWTVNGSQLTFNGADATLTFTHSAIATANAGDSGRELYHGFLVGDVIRSQQVQWNGSAFAGVTLSDLEVSSVTNLYNYGAALVSGDVPAISYDYVRLGSVTDVTRQGAVYLTSDDSAAPFIDIVDGVAKHADWNTAGKIKVRLGKLTGISDSAFGGALSGYGLWGQNVYLTGKFVVTGGTAATLTDVAGKISTGGAAADVNAYTTTITGGKITSGSITALQIQAGSLTGDRINLTSYLAINSSTYGDRGVQIEYNSANPRAYIGNGTTRYFKFDGTTITWKAANSELDGSGNLIATSATLTGAITANTGYIGTAATGWVIAAGEITSTNIGLYAGAANTARLQVGSGAGGTAGINTPSGVSDIVFWAGATHTNRGTATFRVDSAGQVTAGYVTLDSSILISGSATVSGTLTAGAGAIRLATDGQRFVLPDITSVDVPTSSSALRWFPVIGGTHDATKNYTGLVGYRHTSLNVVDMMYTSYVGETDAATYAARMILQAGHQNTSHVYTDARLEVSRAAGTGGRYVDAFCDTFTTSADAYITGNCSALSFTDRTPIFEGDAIAELIQIKSSEGAVIDHETLPTFARVTTTDKEGTVTEGRDIGAMVSILVRAVQQINERLEKLKV